MNILLTSVGRRAYMVKFFKEALGGDGKVFACNSDDKTVAFHYADGSAISPLIYDESYIPFLIDFCKKNKIDAVVSLFDIDLPILAKNRQKFEEIGTHLIVSNIEIVEICNDKWKTFLFLKENGFNVPHTYLTYEDTIAAINSGKLQYPFIVKPRFGCGSIALAVADDEMSLQYLYKKITQKINKSYLSYESAAVEDKIIYQQCLDGQEYGADIINDLDGNFRNTIIRKKIAMRCGETDIAELADIPEIKNILEHLGKLTHHIANMDCDIFLVDGVPYVLEMNARFGGGYPFSQMGGCNLPLAIVKWIKGEIVPDELISAKTEITGYKELYVTQK
jgi:carbamoyl-phosphate synthase large subunit